jgi:hypothetical protein
VNQINPRIRAKSCDPGRATPPPQFAIFLLCDYSRRESSRASASFVSKTRRIQCAHKERDKEILQATDLWRAILVHGVLIQQLTCSARRHLVSLHVRSRPWLLRTDGTTTVCVVCVCCARGAYLVTPSRATSIKNTPATQKPGVDLQRKVAAN